MLNPLLPSHAFILISNIMPVKYTSLLLPQNWGKSFRALKKDLNGFLFARRQCILSLYYLGNLIYLYLCMLFFTPFFNILKITNIWSFNVALQCGGFECPLPWSCLALFPSFFYSNSYFNSSYVLLRLLCPTLPGIFLLFVVAGFVFICLLILFPGWWESSLRMDCSLRKHKTQRICTATSSQVSIGSNATKPEKKVNISNSKDNLNVFGIKPT